MSSKPPGRWSDEETQLLASMREQLGDKLTSRRQLPDVVGDRRLLRFLRGHGKNVDKACEMFSKFLAWRDENKVDEIRDAILRDPCVDRFPHAEKILALVNQIVVAHDAPDNFGNLMCFENFSFDPDAVMKSVSKEEYVEFMTYTLEYRAMVLDQLSEEREEKTLRACNYRPQLGSKPYGVMLQVTCIRDCAGLGMSHVGSAGRTVLGWIISLAGPNYPETLFRSFMIKVPFMIDMVWVVIKQFMDPNTVAKNVMVGSSYMTRLEADMPISSIPKIIGGTYKGVNTMFQFNKLIFAEGTAVLPMSSLPPPSPPSAAPTASETTNGGGPVPAPPAHGQSAFTINRSARIAGGGGAPGVGGGSTAAGGENDTGVVNNQLHLSQHAASSSYSASDINAYAQAVQQHSTKKASVIILTTTAGKAYQSWLPPPPQQQQQEQETFNTTIATDCGTSFYPAASSLLTSNYNGIHQVGESRNVNEYFDLTLAIPPLDIVNPTPSDGARGSVNGDVNCTIS